MQPRRSYKVLVEICNTVEVDVIARTPDEAEDIAEAMVESGDGFLIVDSEIVDSKAEVNEEGEGE